MKEQYVGDINDYRKYALLRVLSADGKNRIGVCWMLTPSDGSSDGNKLDYLTKPEKHRHFDPPLFDLLAEEAAEPDQRRLQAIEDNGAIPDADYFNDLLPDGIVGRRDFMDRCADLFSDVDLVFFDPDNGIEVSLPKGRKNSNKYVYLDELAGFYNKGKSLLVYQHFQRIERNTFVALRIAQLRQIAPGCAIWTFRTAHVVFLLVVHPESPARLAFAANEAYRRWDSTFIAGDYVGQSESEADN